VRLRVARFDEQAMREPYRVERATGDWLHAFLCSKLNLFLPFEAGGKRLNTFKHYETCEEFLSKERPPHDDNGHEYGIRFV
jgi:hypothetical protein